MSDKSLSMADRILSSGGGLLPIGPAAFKLSNTRDSREFIENLPVWFGRLGIIIGEESEVAGWHNCQLPEGWHLQLQRDEKSGQSLSGAPFYDKVTFFSSGADRHWAFRLETSQNPTCSTASLIHTGNSYRAARAAYLQSLCRAGNETDRQVADLMAEHSLDSWELFTISKEVGEFYFSYDRSGFHFFREGDWMTIGYHDALLEGLASGSKQIYPGSKRRFSQSKP